MLIQKDGGIGPFDVLATCLGHMNQDVVLIPIHPDKHRDEEDKQPIIIRLFLDVSKK